MQSDNLCYCMLAVKCSFECKQIIVCVLMYIRLLTAVQQNFLTSIKNIARDHRFDLLTTQLWCLLCAYRNHDHKVNEQAQSQ